MRGSQHFEGKHHYTTEMFNDVVLAMNPARFAAAAYWHFNQSQNGCSFLLRLLQDQHTLPKLPQW